MASTNKYKEYFCPICRTTINESALIGNEKSSSDQDWEGHKKMLGDEERAAMIAQMMKDLKAKKKGEA